MSTRIVVGMNPRPFAVAIAAGLCVASLCTPAAHAQSRTLNAVFTPTPLDVDGRADAAWSQAAPSAIAICMNPARTAQLDDCTVTASVQALWNGPLLYLLFTVTDPDVDTASPMDARRSGVQVFVDQYNDKFPKFEEDDGSLVVSAAGQQSGNRPNANLPYYPALWSTHLHSSAAAPRTDSTGRTIGYVVEIAWHIGDLPLRNGTKIGMEFAINAVASASHALQYQLYWSNGQNKGTYDNTMWGEVVLAGYDASSRMPVNTYMLQQNVKNATASMSSATGLVRGIWKDESAVDRALAAAESVLRGAESQLDIDTANTAIDAALKGLRRSGKYPDPYDLPAVNNLPDPFTFLNGSKVRTAADWERRRAEIKDLAQYYEFGYMPARPQALTAASTDNPTGALRSRSIAITAQDRGREASFTPVLFLPPTGSAPYPVVVQLDFRSSPNATPNRAFTQAGYAVLSIGSPGVASDDGNHTGAFYTLYRTRWIGTGTIAECCWPGPGAPAAAWMRWSIWRRTTRRTRTCST